MKAITLWQPWASLIAIGAKQYETRSWATFFHTTFHHTVKEVEAAQWCGFSPLYLFTTVEKQAYGISSRQLRPAFVRISLQFITP